MHNQYEDVYKRQLSALSKPPKLMITDSQVFPLVYEKKPEESLLTSFSVLFAKYKGDIQYFIKSAKAIDQLTVNSRVLIAEACTPVSYTHLDVYKRQQNNHNGLL